MGGQNFHVDVIFEDGVTWIARIQQDHPLMAPSHVRDLTFLSEASTLKFLADAAVPSPTIFHYALASSDNPVGMSFMLLEKMAGTPLDWATTTGSQRAKILSQLADAYLELEKHPLHLTGSLFPAGSTSQVGPFSQLELFASPEEPLGPFTTSTTAYISMFQRQLSLLATHQFASLPVDHYLAFGWRLEAISAVNSSTAHTGPFYLKHYDDKGDHILLDEDYNITGIIDWEWASAEVKEYAFSSPCMTWDIGDYYNGSNTLSKAEMEFAQMFERRGRRDIADIVRNGRKLQRFLFFNGGGMSADIEEFEALFQGERAAIESTQDTSGQSYQEWRREAVEKYYKGDGVLQSLLRTERAGSCNLNKC